MADTITTAYEVGDGLKIVNEVLIVDTTDKIEANNSRPISSRGVASEIGDLSELLANI